MAQRRMFSNRIAGSARFLQMPIESQLFYFHAVLRADDDGIVESYPLMKLLGIAPDNFKVLMAKGFIKQLNDDQVIVITDWTEHNTIRADRKVNSIYLPLLQDKYPKLPVVEPKPRLDVKDNSKRVGGLSTDGIGKVRLGKDSIGEDSIGKEITPSTQAKLFFSSKEGQDRVIQELISKGLKENIVRQEIEKFISYWTEMNKSGSKQRWGGEKYFDITRRLSTWFKNFERFSGNGQSLKEEDIKVPDYAKDWQNKL